MSVIEAVGLTKRYGDRVAVGDLSFRVEPGTVTGFLGPNGAGKSTTMRLMLGLDHGSGRTTFDGKTYGELTQPLRTVGTLLDAKAFHPTRTARNHLRMLASANAIPMSRVDQCLELVGLTSVAGRKPKDFSLGMGQRLGLAAALLGDPQVLILDEPANGLDPQGINWLRSFLQGYAAQGRSVFVSSHLLAEMALMADHLVVIGRGRLITEGAVSEFTDRSQARNVVVRSPRIGELAEVVRAAGAEVVATEADELRLTGIEQARVGDLALERGIAVHELRTHRPTLEQAFLEVTEGSEEFGGETTGGATAAGAGSGQEVSA